jgi:hypothetical protein
MTTNECVQEFSYRNSARVMNILPLILAWIVFPLLMFALIGFTYIDLIREPLTGKEVIEFLGLCLSVIFLIIFSHQDINHHNSIQVLEKGLRVRVFFFIFLWKFIPWSDVISIELSPLVDRWNNSVWVIVVKRLTFWHRRLSVIYRVGNLPGIILSSDLNQRGELMDLVEKHISQRDEVQAK